MVLDFLEKYEEELFTSKIELKEQLDQINTQIKEDEKFIQLLINDSSSNFSDFSPREMTTKSQDKIEELEKSLSEKVNKKSDTEKKITFIDERLDEVSGYISEVKADIIPKSCKEEYIEFENIKEDIQEKIDHKSNINNSVISSLKAIDSFLPQDSMRAKIELENLIKKLMK